jgi:signal transduction histidine kinase
MKAVIAYLLLLPCWLLAGTDSLLAELNSHKYNDTTKVRLYYAYATNIAESDFNTSKQYFEQAIELAELLKNKKIIADAYLAYAQAFDEQSLHDSAIIFYTKAAKYYRDAGMIAKEASVINLRGIAYENTVNYVRAFNDYFEALRLFSSVDDSKGIANAYINIGLIYQYQDNYKLSNRYLYDALKICREIKDKKGEMAVYNNLAINFKHTGEKIKALEYFRMAYEYDKSQNDYLYMSYSLNNIGTVYEEMGMYDSAYHFYKIAAGYKVLNKDKVGLGNTLNNIASALISLKQYAEARRYLDSSESINMRYGYTNNMVQTYFNRYRIYQANGDYKNALEYFIKYKSTEDSIIKTDNNRILAATQHQYEMELINNKLSNQELTIAQTIRSRNVNVAIIIILLITIGYLFYSYQIRVKLNKKLQLQASAIDDQNKKLRQINQELLDAKETAERAVKAKSQFLSIMSHEIRTPLNAISAIANLLENSDDTRINKQNIHVLQSASENLVNLVNDILDLSKMESGKVYLSHSPFNLHKLVNHIAGLFDANAKAKGISIRVEYEASLPHRFVGDELRINQVLSNLISNAIKFTEKGEVVIKVLNSGVESDTYNLYLEVADTGIGIPKEKQSLIFKSFEQVDNTSTRKYGGTGLGLTICKRILSLYGTELKLISEPDKGSVFYFNILMPAAADVEKETTSKSIPDYPEKYSGKKLLIVEDNPVNVYVLNQFLQRLNVQTEVAEDGKKALELIEKFNPDLILMDIHMPEMDGYETTRNIRMRKINIPIIAVTASNSINDSEKEKALIAGMNDMLLKPFQPDELHRLLAKYLS